METHDQTENTHKDRSLIERKSDYDRCMEHYAHMLGMEYRNGQLYRADGTAKQDSPEINEGEIWKQCARYGCD